MLFRLQEKKYWWVAYLAPSYGGWWQQYISRTKQTNKHKYTDSQLPARWVACLLFCWLCGLTFSLGKVVVVGQLTMRKREEERMDTIGNPNRVREGRYSSLSIPPAAVCCDCASGQQARTNDKRSMCKLNQKNEDDNPLFLSVWSKRERLPSHLDALDIAPLPWWWSGNSPTWTDGLVFYLPVVLNDKHAHKKETFISYGIFMRHQWCYKMCGLKSKCIKN